MAVGTVAHGVQGHHADQVGFGQQARRQRELVDGEHHIALVAVGRELMVDQGRRAQQADHQVPRAQEAVQREARQRQQRMPFAHGADVGQRFQRQGAQGRAEVRIHARRHVDFAFFQQHAGVVQRVGMQMDADIGRHRLLLHEQRPDDLIRHVVGHGHAEHGLGARRIEIVAFQCVGDAGQRVADRRPQEFGALRGQHAALYLHEQRVLQSQAQPVDGIADCGLRHVQRRGRTRDVAFGHDRIKDA